MDSLMPLTVCCPLFTTLDYILLILRFYKTRNTTKGNNGTRNTGRITKHLVIVAGTTEYPQTLTEHQRNTPEQRNIEPRRTIAFMR